MADPTLHRLICELCQTKFRHHTIRKTCSDDCRERGFEEQRAETIAYRCSRTKKCRECHRVFSWEDVGGITESAFDRRPCCSAECWQKYQKKQTAARNSIIYHGVRLSIEDVCKLEQKGIQTIRLLMKKGDIPGAKWAEPELRRAHAALRTSAPSVLKDEIVKVRMTRERKDAIEAYARWRGMNTAADLLMQSVQEEMRRKPKR